MAPALQAKLLRVLQEREFERVGGTRTIRADIRLVAATNRDLGDMASRGAFRQDLYYRLNVVSLRMPPLRDRREDIRELAHSFVLKHARNCKRDVSGISPEALERLIGHNWPGNVRELENAVERAVVLGTTSEILAEDLPDSVLEASSSEVTGGYHAAVAEAKRQIVRKALERAGGNYSEAGLLLGLHPNNVYRLVRTLKMKEELKQTGE